MRDWLILRVRATVRRLRPDGTLMAQTVKSGLWATGINVGTRLLQMVMMIILARILGPREFGLMGIALLTNQALNRFSRLGLDRALVQHRERNVDRYLDTTWVVQMARGVVIAALLFVGAPFVASFFGEPRVTLILRVVALSPLLAGMFNPSIVYFEKDLDMHKKFAFDISGATAEFVVAVSFALVYQSVWALVFGFLAADATRLIASYALHEYRPGLRVSWEHARELIGYGKWITATSGISFLLTSGDDAIVGRLLSTTALGYYQIGYRLGKTPPMEASRSLSTVVFPMYSQLQEDADALAGALRRVVRLLSFVSLPAAVGVVVTAPLFVEGILGPQWLPVIPVMQIVAVYGAFSGLTSAFSDIWNAIGRPDLNTKINAFRLVVTGALIYPATVAYGFVGTAASIAGVFLVLIVPLKFHLAVESVDTDHTQLLTELAYPVLASGVMGVALLALRRTLAFSTVVEFLCLVLAGIAVYVAAVAVIEARSAWRIGADVREMLSAVRS